MHNIYVEYRINTTQIVLNLVSARLRFIIVDYINFMNYK